jgi:hypothetical protein
MMVLAIRRRSIILDMNSRSNMVVTVAITVVAAVAVRAPDITVDRERCGSCYRTDDKNGILNQITNEQIRSLNVGARHVLQSDKESHPHSRS